ncbi:MAG: efflux RND transporter periplasmic adaptor subunit [Hyphomicrobiaceae bacterium]|nr:efflux RND transporter periplasmic adaptor subunit [Hyphomicrobiaceae bacterium]
MPRLDSTATTLVIAVALAAALGYGVNEWTEARRREQQTASLAPPVTQGAAAKSDWLASAPGRVEPRGGEVRLSAQAPGRVVEVLARVNDRVQAGDLLVRLDEEEARARLAAAEAEEAVRRRERDAETVGKPAQDRRAAEDALASAQRSLHAARVDLDRLLAARRRNAATPDEVVRARAALDAAEERADQERSDLRRAAAASGMPLPTRPESALAQARAEVLLAEIAFERTRIRAPIDAGVLQVNVKAGELLTPSPELVAMTLGDVTALRVRAEVEERDIGKIRAGQRVVVRSDAFPGRDFEGRVASTAAYVGPPRLGSRGPRKPTDVDILEVLIDLDGRPPLLPGMRTDVFFRPDVTSQLAPPRVN